MKCLHLFAIFLIAFIAGCEQSQPAPVVTQRQQERAAQNSTEQAHVQPELGSWEDLQSLIANLDTRISGIEASGGKVSTTRNFYLVFDGSGSMSGDKIAQAKKAVNTVIRGLPADYNLGLYLFDNRGSREEVPLGANNHQRILQAINNSLAGGGTPLGDAILTGNNKLVEQFKRQLGYGEYRLIVITDGEADINSPVTRGTGPANTNGIPIYSIGFNVRGHSLEQYSAFFTTASNEAELLSGLGQVFGELDTFESFDSTK